MLAWILSVKDDSAEDEEWGALKWLRARAQDEIVWVYSFLQSPLMDHNLRDGLQGTWFRS